MQNASGVAFPLKRRFLRGNKPGDFTKSSHTGSGYLIMRGMDCLYKGLLNNHELIRRGKMLLRLDLFIYIWAGSMFLPFLRHPRGNFVVLAWPFSFLCFLSHSARHQIFCIISSWNVSFIWTMQLFYLDEWALLDRDHSNSLSGATEALKASTLRLPVIGGARVSSLRILKCRIQFTYDEIYVQASISVCHPIVHL